MFTAWHAVGWNIVNLLNSGSEKTKTVEGVCSALSVCFEMAPISALYMLPRPLDSSLNTYEATQASGIWRLGPIYGLIFDRVFNDCSDDCALCAWDLSNQCMSIELSLLAGLIENMSLALDLVCMRAFYRVQSQEEEYASPAAPRSRRAPDIHRLSVDEPFLSFVHMIVAPFYLHPMVSEHIFFGCGEIDVVKRLIRVGGSVMQDLVANVKRDQDRNYLVSEFEKAISSQISPAMNFCEYCSKHKILGSYESQASIYWLVNSLLLSIVLIFEADPMGLYYDALRCLLIISEAGSGIDDMDSKYWWKFCRKKWKIPDKNLLKTFLEGGSNGYIFCTHHCGKNHLPSIRLHPDLAVCLYSENAAVREAIPAGVEISEPIANLVLNRVTE